jgi:hypothetical protein
MKNPCFEHQATDHVNYDPEAEKAYWEDGKMVIDPKTSKAFFKEAKAWADTGLTFPEVLDQMQRTRGLRRQTIANILTADKTASRMTDEAWLRQARYRELKSAAQHLVDQANTETWAKHLDHAWTLSRAMATVYHGGAIPFTHAKNLALSVLRPKEIAVWGNMIKDAYRYAPAPFRRPSTEQVEAFKNLMRGDVGFREGMKDLLKAPGKGEQAWAKDMATMVGSDDWVDAARHKVEVLPQDHPVGILASIEKGWGVRTFDALKKGRVQLYKLRKQELERGLGQPLDDVAGDALGHEINMATGTMRMSASHAKLMAAAMFAPKVWLTRRLEAATPIRYAIGRAGKISAGERAVLNQALKDWAVHVGVTMAILEGNDLFNKYFTDGTQRVNFFDWHNPGTLWRMNWGGHIIPLSPFVEAARAPVAAAAIMLAFYRRGGRDEAALRGEAPTGAAGEILFREVLNAIHPSLAHLLELWTGRQVFGEPRHLRRLPSVEIPGTGGRRFPGVAQLVRGEEREKDPAMGWIEYLLSDYTAIPVGEAAKEIFSPALTDQGMSRPQADKVVKALTSFGFSSQGVHTFEKTDKGPMKTRHKAPPGTLKSPQYK